MPDGQKLPPAQQKKMEKIRAAYDAFLSKMGVLKKKRMELTERMLKRIEKKKIDDILKSL